VAFDAASVWRRSQTAANCLLLSHQRCAAAGSTDDTEAIVAKTMDGVPGQLLHSKFVDFAQVGALQCPLDVSLHSLIGLAIDQG
jgi:hypothetical protein